MRTARRAKTSDFRAGIERTLAQVVRLIVREFAPERILLFGSRARGNARPDSDLDLLVVMPFSGTSREKAVEIAVALHHVHVATDIFVVTPFDYAWRRHIVGTIEYAAAREGKTLHERH